MAVAVLDEIFRASSGALIGLDLGTKTIGVALSDPGRRFAVPRLVIARVKFTGDAARLLEIAAENSAAAFVMGLPLNMERLTALPFVFWDERLSTVAAERALISMDVSRAKRAERIDAAAAAFILQGALDRLYAISAGAEVSS
jgi:putative holliday junction resolvase